MNKESSWQHCCKYCSNYKYGYCQSKELSASQYIELENGDEVYVEPKVEINNPDTFCCSDWR